MQQRFLLQILLFAQHVSGITMPIIKSIIQWLLRVVFCAVRVNQHPANQTHNRQLHTRPATWKNHSTKYHMQQPLYNTLELLMMGIVMPETCWASNTICNKTSVASSWHFISTYKVWASYPYSRYEKQFFCSTENTLKRASIWIWFWCCNIQGGERSFLDFFVVLTHDIKIRHNQLSTCISKCVTIMRSIWRSQLFQTHVGNVQNVSIQV